MGKGELARDLGPYDTGKSRCTSEPMPPDATHRLGCVKALVKQRRRLPTLLRIALEFLPEQLTGAGEEILHVDLAGVDLLQQ